jgi:amidohydrolase
MSVDALLIRAKAMKNELVAVRRDSHRHPELAFQEQRTAETGCDWLHGLGLEVQVGIAGTYGLVATLESGCPGPTLLIRADMDALPIPYPPNSAERTLPSSPSACRP